MDGLFELLIILFILLFPVLEALAKKRRRERGEGGGGPGLPEGPRERTPVPADAPPDRTERDEPRSDLLLPDDLWEELTGERRRRSPGEPGTGAGGGVATAEERPLASEEEPGGPWRERAEADVEPGAADVPGPEGVIGRTEVGGSEARRAGEPPVPGEPDEVAEPDRAELLREIGAGEGGLRRRRASELARVRPDLLARRGAPAASARESHPLLGDLDREALRRAILYREILGPPKALDES